MSYTHVLTPTKEVFDSVKEGDNYQNIRFPKRPPKEGDELLHMHGEEQKRSVIAEVGDTTGLMKGYYLVHHVVKGE